MKTKTKGVAAAALGSNTMAVSLDEVVIGRFNELSTSNKGHKEWNIQDAVFRVGVGTSAKDRKDAFRVMKNGAVVVNGDLAVTGVVYAADVVNAAGRRLAEAGAEETLLAKIAALEEKVAQLLAKEQRVDELEAKVAQLLASSAAA